MRPGLRNSLLASVVAGAVLGLALLHHGVAGRDPAVKRPATKPANHEPSARAKAALTKAMRSSWQELIKEWKSLGSEDPADNSFCYVCHANYRKERLVALHEPTGVGCETCHGISDKHSEDEDGLIPPDILFPKEQVASFCLQCHEKEALAESSEDHQDFFAGKLKPQETCTDCHGMHHELKVRTRRWNKWTRELAWSDGVRMMQTRDEKEKKDK